VRGVPGGEGVEQPARDGAHRGKVVDVHAIFEWIESWYNARRRHSTLDYLSPAAYEATVYHDRPDRKVA
jgi:hypothetical protein